MADKVRAVAQELWLRHQHARPVAGRRGPRAPSAWSCTRSATPTSPRSPAACCRWAALEGLTVQICHTGRDPELELGPDPQPRRQPRRRDPGRGLRASSTPRSRRPCEMECSSTTRSAGGRVALIGRHHLKAATACCPTTATADGAITEHVLALGHRRICLASGSQSLTTVADRIAGQPRGARRRGDRPRLGAGARGRLHPRRRPGLACATSSTSTPTPPRSSRSTTTWPSACWAEGARAGVSVPGAVSVTGFDDVAVAEDVAPGLTTIGLPMAEMGAKALQLALKEPGQRLRRPRMPERRSCGRGSTGPVRAGSGPREGRAGQRQVQGVADRGRGRRRARARACAGRFPTSTIVRVPVADGGDGTLVACADAGSSWWPVTVAGPTGEVVTTAYARRGDVAVVELADASGLARLACRAARRWTASTVGTGQALAAAVAARVAARSCSASGAAPRPTAASGCSSARRRGARRGGSAVPPDGAAWRTPLASTSRPVRDAAGRHPGDGGRRRRQPPAGADGRRRRLRAAEGRDGPDVVSLERGLARWADLVADVAGADHRDAPGAGAAGGAGFAALALLGAGRRPGVEVGARPRGLRRRAAPGPTSS